MKIAIITNGDPSDTYGAFNAVHNRIKHLLPYKGLVIDVFMIRTYESKIVRILRKSNKKTKEDYFIYDGIVYHNLWLDFSLIDYFLRVKMKLQGPFYFSAVKKWVKLFKDYDFLTAHSYNAGILAYIVNKKHNIPFALTWHGSDIHSEPFSNKSVYAWTKKLLEKANCNFFVSQNLSNVAKKITNNSNNKLLYNGVNTNKFKNYDENELKAVREKFNININNKNIAFVGGLVPIKNVDKLPEIFGNIKSELPESRFFIIGNGKLRSLIEKKCTKLSIDVSFLGDQKYSNIPALINCMNLILLPSKNEGLPLVTLESLACGVPVIGSRVGGIVEAIGMENTVELDDMFIDNFSKMAINHLKNKHNTELNLLFDWKKTAEKEAHFYYKFI